MKRPIVFSTRVAREHAGRLQRYLNEIIWRWNHREATAKVKQRRSRLGRTTKTTAVWKPIPVVEQMRLLLGGAVLRQVRRSAYYGLRWF